VSATSSSCRSFTSGSLAVQIAVDDDPAPARRQCDRAQRRKQKVFHGDGEWPLDRPHIWNSTSR
jgi:hypothetical protein